MIDKVVGDSLSSLEQHGAWTLMQPIYTKEVGTALPDRGKHEACGSCWQEVDCVQVVGRTPVTTSDKIAHGLVKLLR